jgi:hypothetical protein
MPRTKKKKKRRKINLDNPNSATWRDKADGLWSDLVKIRDGFKCAICGKEGKPRKDGFCSKGLHSHHIVSRTRFRLRHDVDNGICLCNAHHGTFPWYQNWDYSVHGDNDSFIEWLKINRPLQHNWYLNNKDDKRMPDLTYEESYNLLLNIKKESCNE